MELFSRGVMKVAFARLLAALPAKTFPALFSFSSSVRGPPARLPISVSAETCKAVLAQSVER